MFINEHWALTLKRIEGMKTAIERLFRHLTKRTATTTAMSINGGFFVCDCECNVLCIELINYFDHLIMHAERAPAPPHVIIYVFLSVFHSHSHTMEQTKEEKKAAESRARPEQTGPHTINAQSKGHFIAQSDRLKSSDPFHSLQPNHKTQILFFVRFLTALRNSITRTIRSIMAVSLSLWIN